MSKVKVGILGAGFIAKVHIGNLKNDERTEIVSVADLYYDKAKALAQEAGPQASPFSSLDELLAQGGRRGLRDNAEHLACGTGPEMPGK